MRSLLRRLWYLVGRRRFDSDLAEELDFHRAMKQRDLEDAGLEERNATFATRRALGSIALAQDHVRDVWCPSWLQGLGQDLRLAFRSLRGTGMVTTVAILSLALGIGANTAVFSLVNSLLLRTLPVRVPDRLTLLSNSPYGGTSDWDYPIWREISNRAHLFGGSMAWSPTRFNLSSGAEAQFVEGAWASGSFFQTLGVPAWRGRTFGDVDDVRGGGPNGAVAVISYGFWQRHFGGTPDISHLTLTLDRVPFTIVGVTPPSFFGIEVGRAIDVIIPLGTEPLIRGRDTWLDRHDYWLMIMVRLRSEQTLEAATLALRSVQPQIRESTLPMSWRREYRDTYLKAPIVLVPAATGLSVFRVRYQRALMTILVVVALVLLIACVNIASLLMARASARRHELSVRIALGASRWRLVRQLLAESALLGASGTVLGAFLASWGSPLVVRQLSTPSNPVFLDLSLDWHVLTFTTGVASAATLLFGLIPAWAGSANAAIDTLTEHTPHRRGESGRGLAEGGLVVAQVALSLVLVVGAGLFGRTFLSLTTREAGFARHDVLIAEVDAQSATPDLSRRIPLYDEVFVGGRDFTEADRPDTAHVAIVNETFARASMNGASPIGHTLTMTTPGRVMKTEIVGVVADSVYFSLRETVHPTVYTPLDQFYFAPSVLPSISVIVRTIGPLGAMNHSVARSFTT